MDHNEWVRYGIEHLHDAKTAGRADLYGTIDRFRGLSAYDHHAWYKASKSMINALFWSFELVSGAGLAPGEITLSPGDFADRLAAHRTLADLMIKDLDRHAEEYQQEHDVKAPPDLLSTVRDRTAAFRATIQHVIDKAPSGIFRRA